MASQVNEQVANNATTPTKAAAATTPSSENKPTTSLSNATREELVDVLQKMNKKVKALSALRTQLAEKAQAAEQERDTLLVLFKEDVLKGMDQLVLDPEKPQMQQLQDLWKKKDEQNKQQLDNLQAQMQALQTNGTAPAPSTTPSSGEDNNNNMAALREQLQQEHQRALAALKDSLTKQHAEDIAKGGAAAVAAAESTGSPTGEKSTSEIEDLKTKHAADMTKLKQAAAMQIQNFKKKVATARAAELEKTKIQTAAETRAKVEEELKTQSSSSPSNEEAAKIKEQLQQHHAKEMQSMKEHLQTGHAQEMGQI